MTNEDGKLCCDMEHGCEAPITRMDNKGYIYCEKHGIERRDVRPCRKLRPFELRRLEKRLPVMKY